MGIENVHVKSIELLNSIAIKVTNNEKEQLIKIAKTSMQTKLVSKESNDLATIVVTASQQVV